MRNGTICAWGLAAAVGLAPAATAQNDADMKAMMETMQRVATPGEHHRALAGFLGEWDVDLTVLIPGAPPQKSKGRATYAWAIEGMWLTQRLDATLMGAPYRSFGVFGYDNFAKNHVMMNVSSVDTAMLVARGVVVDPEGKVMAVYGTLNEYLTNDLNKPWKAVTRVHDANRHVIEVWDLGVGAEGVKVMEFAYTRKS